MINDMTIKPIGENLSMLPDLTPKQTGETKAFKVILNGGIESTSSIKSFKWISNPTTQEEAQKIEAANKTLPSSSIPKTSTNLDNFKQNITNIIIDKATENLKNKTQTQTQPQTTTQTQEITNTTETTKPTQQNSSGFSDFIDSLPDLKIK